MFGPVFTSTHSAEVRAVAANLDLPDTTSSGNYSRFPVFHYQRFFAERTPAEATLFFSGIFNLA